MANRQKRDRYYARRDQNDPRRRGHLEPEPRDNGRKLYARRPSGMGVTGLRHAGGQIYEEWKTEFRSWSQAVKIYLEMRDDVTVGTLLDAMKLPILAAPFTVSPAEANTAGDQAAADWLYDNMHRMHRQAWKSHVSDSLDSIDFGWSVGEIILERRQDSRFWLKNIDPRGQETLERWRFDDQHKDEAIAMVQRDPNSGVMIPIPLSKCVHVTFRGRKGNPQGRSLLYSLHRPWRMLKDHENFEGIGVERDVGGMPMAELPEGDISTDDMDELEDALKGFRRDENEFVVTPPGVKIAPYASGGSKQFDIGTIIERKKKEILGRRFAQFLMLGMDNVGTQALVEGSQDFFSLGLRAVQEDLTEAWNQQLVPYLFFFNTFPGMTDNPTIEWAKPGAKDIAAALAAVSTAVGAKIWTPTDADEDHVRELMDWPELPEDEKGMPRDVEEPPMEGIFTPKITQTPR